MLEERQRTLADLAALSDKLQAAAGAQQSAIESMVSRAAGTLEELSARFGERLHGEADKLAEITAHAADSSADMASLGESFSLAVQLFSDSNAQLVDNLGRIEESMEKSTERSDEQMSYYVAQAREIIDQSMLSQREIIEELRRLGQTGEMFAAEAS
jgi:ABC-type transporter Mla subunit MlaD